MSSRDIAIDFIKTLPADIALQEIAHKLEFIAGIYQAQEEAERGEGVSAEEAYKLVDSWVSQAREK